MNFFKKFKIDLYNKWSPTTKLMFWLAVISIFIGLIYGGSKIIQIHFGSGDNVAGDKITISKNKFISENGEIDMKTEIRKVLKDTNLTILSEIDSGSKEIKVMFSQPNLMALQELKTYPGFDEYLHMNSTGSISNSNANTIGGHINDINDGFLNGYALYPTDKLRINS